MFIALVIVAIRTSPAWLTTWSTLKLATSNRNAERIKELEAQVKACQETIEGLRKQRNHEQLVIMRAIVGMSSDPQVKQQLELLEAMEISLKKGAQDGNGK
jgi:hypothetical protein